MSAVTSPHSLAFVVLAAGRGSRLDDAGYSGPKWLLPVGDLRIADHQCAGLGAAFTPGDRALVVTGFATQDVVAFLAEQAVIPAAEPLTNEYWDDRNNWYSLLVALEQLSAEQWQGGVVVVNSDLCARAGLFTAFVEQARRIGTEQGILAVDLVRELTDEAMKVAAVHDTDGARCIGIGKVGVPDPVGEYIGLAALPPARWHQLIEVLRGFQHSERHDEWYEAGFRVLMQDGGPGFAVWPTPDSNWVEVDDGADWSRAVAMMGAS
jgi:choline kinase